MDDHYGAVTNHFPVYKAILGMVTPDQTTNQPGDPSASLLLILILILSFAICRNM